MFGSNFSLPRPGACRGSNPEREAHKQSALEKRLDRLTQHIQRWWATRIGDEQTFLDQVEAASQFWTTLDENLWPQEIKQLRFDLVSQGLRRPQICRAFALIREQANQALGKRHYSSQLLGGLSLLNGRIAEMETGEGKTLTATLAAGTAALAGIPVHVITVNDYLAQRDAGLMQPLYRQLDLTVGVIQEGMSATQRRAAYACHITYCSNKQVAFDYLKDRLALGGNSHNAYKLGQLAQPHPSGLLLMRGLCYAIIDEADSVLIDEAKTPLILSKQVKEITNLQEINEAIQLARQLIPDSDFVTQTKTSSVHLTENGKNKLQQATVAMVGMWQGARRREAMVQLALRALYCFARDKHYLVKDGVIQIIDEFTGRTMPDRSWDKLLHQMIQVKERCAVTGHLETLARIAYQRFFSRYLKLSGMTGTAREVAGELAAVYGLTVDIIPSHRPSQRRHYPSRFYLTEQEKWRKVVGKIKEINRQQRPLLVGTRTLAASEYLSTLLQQQSIAHQLLNARQNQQEAECIALAGQPGQVTIATNMAGRGTDILLNPKSASAGGLHVISTERHEAGRIDRQLFGRCARQGDTGSVEEFLSFEDELIKKHCPNLGRWFTQWVLQYPTLIKPLGKLLVSYAQRSAERHQANIRKMVFEQDQKTKSLLGFAGRSE